jgi:hypothetical protein
MAVFGDFYEEATTLYLTYTAQPELSSLANSLLSKVSLVVTFYRAACIWHHLRGHISCCDFVFFLLFVFVLSCCPHPVHVRTSYQSMEGF